MTASKIIAVARRDCVARHGRVEWVVRTAPLTEDGELANDWDGTTWNLRDLGTYGKPGRRYVCDAFKPGGEIAVAVYEIEMPDATTAAPGKVFRQVMKRQPGGVVAFEFEEIQQEGQQQ